MKNYTAIFSSLLVLFSLTKVNAQSTLYNYGTPGLTLQINNSLVVHADSDVENLTGATMAFGSSGEPNLEFDGHFTNSTSAT